MNQVFLNLITNAAQAIETDGTLTVETRADLGQVEIRIEDTGIGIAQDILPRIFDPFFTTKTVGESTGLGLSVVHKIVQTHGGSIAVQSAPGKGSCFTITLPAELNFSPTLAKTAVNA